MDMCDKELEKELLEYEKILFTMLYDIVFNIRINKIKRKEGKIIFYKIYGVMCNYSDKFTILTGIELTKEELEYIEFFKSFLLVDFITFFDKPPPFKGINKSNKRIVRTFFRLFKPLLQN